MYTILVKNNFRQPVDEMFHFKVVMGRERVRVHHLRCGACRFNTTFPLATKRQIFKWNISLTGLWKLKMSKLKIEKAMKKDIDNVIHFRAVCFLNVQIPENNNTFPDN